MKIFSFRILCQREIQAFGQLVIQVKGMVDAYITRDANADIKHFNYLNTCTTNVQKVPLFVVC